MSHGDELAFSPQDFSGTARLFPLPGLVMFPHVMQPLHIFEPRYREMMEATLADDRMMALATLRPGWEPQYEGRPPLQEIACLGRVATHQRLADGRFNLLLLGLRRVRLLEELPPVQRYREARVQVLEDVYPAQKAAARPQLSQRLAEAFLRAAPHLEETKEQLDSLLGAGVPLGMLTDIVAYTLELPATIKERLLAELDVDARAALLLESLKGPRDAGRPFPPEFSVN